MALVKITCKTCAKDFEVETSGKRPIYCPEHSKRHDRNQALRRKAASGDDTAKEELEKLGLAPSAAEAELSRRQRFAVFYGQSGRDPEAAAELAGLTDIDDETLALYVELAEGPLAPLTEVRQEALTDLGNAVLVLTMLRLRDSIQVLPASLLGNTIKQAADVMERLTGGVAPSHSNIEVIAKFSSPPPKR